MKRITYQLLQYGESVVTTDYEYDALNRLTSASYSNPNNPGAGGTAFGYTYDAAGNVLEYTATINGQSTVTSYQYDAANQLLTATKDSTVWHYTYDGNGSLVQSNPGDTLSNSAKRYTYTAAGFLLKVETYTNSWQTQADMTYDGLGNTSTGSVTAAFEMTAAGNITFYLYGLGPIGELTTTWNYSLPDGGSTPRQLADANGEVTYFARYTPWGDTLETFGTGRFTQGYFGGMMDIATGLIYVGNGQYYDPATGRFLTRDARPNQNNPYTPIDPTSALLGPLALLALAYGRKKSRGKWDTLVILLVLSLSLGMGLAACGTLGTTMVTQTHGNITATAYISPPAQNGNVNVSLTLTATIPGANGAPDEVVTLHCAGVLTPSPTPTGPNLDYDVLTWGNNDLDETWRQQRSQWVWEWLGRRGGFWGSGYPDVKTLVTFLLIGEGVGLMNVTSSGNRFTGLRVMVWYMRSLFDDADGITAKDLSTYTAFFNPKRGDNGAWNQKDRDKFQKGPGEYTLNISRGFVDDYWNAGPTYDQKTNKHIVYRWWDNTEHFNYTMDFGVNIPSEKVMVDGKLVDKILYFGY